MDTTVITKPKTATRQKIRLATLFFMVITFPILMNYFSVFLIIEGSANGIMTFSFFFWSSWVLLALLFGRAACGYLCPLGAFQEIKDRAVPKKLARVKYVKFVKYVLSLAWVAVIVGLAVSAGGYHSINLFYNTEHGVSIDSAEGWITYIMIITIILLPAFLMGKRGFCHYFCPWGVLNTIGTRIKNFLRIPSLHLVPDSTVCRQCRTCTRNCPMNLPVNEMVKAESMTNSECILCGTCVDNCPAGAIKYSWTRPETEAETKRTPVMENADGVVCSFDLQSRKI